MIYFINYIMETIIKKSIELTNKYDKLLIQKRKIQKEEEELEIQVETFRILQEIKHLCPHNGSLYKEKNYDSENEDYYIGTSIICNICDKEISLNFEE